MEWWLKKEETNIYIKAIQDANTARLGWLLFSFPEINTKAFCLELLCRIGEQVAAGYKPILIETWDTLIKPKTRLKALHSECDKRVEK